MPAADDDKDFQNLLDRSRALATAALPELTDGQREHLAATFSRDWVDRVLPLNPGGMPGDVELEANLRALISTTPKLARAVPSVEAVIAHLEKDATYLPLDSGFRSTPTQRRRAIQTAVAGLSADERLAYEIDESSQDQERTENRESSKATAPEFSLENALAEVRAAVGDTEWFRLQPSERHKRAMYVLRHVFKQPAKQGNLLREMVVRTERPMSAVERLTLHRQQLAAAKK